MANRGGDMNSKGKPKAAKEGAGTGLLMSVIRTLSASEDLKQREVEKARLEKAYRECDGKLDSLITDNYETLTKTIQAYSNISGRIKTSRERVKILRSDLESCKELLHCRRDELRKLWLEGIEQKHVLGLLDQIEEVNNVPQKLSGYLGNKHYLHATELVTKTVAMLEGDLKGVEALSELRLEMLNHKEILHQDLIKELNQQIYDRSSATFQPTFVRASSIRSSGGFDVTSSKQKPTLMELANSARRAAVRAQNAKSLIIANLEEEPSKPIREDLNEDPYENAEHYMAILVESLSLLKRIPEAVEIDDGFPYADPDEEPEAFIVIVLESLLQLIKIEGINEAIKSDVAKELNKIVQRTTTEVAENAKLRGENVTQHNQPKLLLELLELLFEKFRCVATAHKTVLGSLQRVTGGKDIQLYNMDEVWSNIQTVLQYLLNNYLDVRNMTTQARETASAFNETPTDIGVYFSRRRHAQQRRVPLFRFEHSSHAISMTNYIREQKQEFYGHDGKVQTEEEAGEETQMVCKPSVNNITLIFKPLSQFIKDIEAAMNLSDGCHCTLHEFISDYVKEIFMDHLLSEIETEIQAATKASEAVKALIDGQTQKGLGSERPLLHNTFMVDRSVMNLKQLMMDLPTYADQFLNMICNILQEYKETCQATYRGVVQPDVEDKRIVSASWIKDDGINQCLRLLPNWVNLQQQSKPGKDSQETTQETIEDIRERNSKESELLVTNLGDKLLQDHEVLCDISSLKLLANLHESLEWFASRIKAFAAQLPSHGFNALTASATQTLEIPAVDDSLLHSLISQAKDIKDLADTCLLVLHLELRLHCFFFLLPVAKHSSFHTSVDSVDPDPNVVKLNKDLTALEDAMTVSLQPHKFKYVFEGLGHLISFILINSAQYIKRMNDNGIKKMCRNIFMLQQNLTNITMSRETDLDHARSYYELLYKTADEILNSIVEQGASFKELEYRNAVILLQRSSSAFDQKQKQRQLKKLEEIMMEAV